VGSGVLLILRDNNWMIHLTEMLQRSREPKVETETFRDDSDLVTVYFARFCRISVAAPLRGENMQEYFEAIREDIHNRRYMLACKFGYYIELSYLNF
jgi:hypothetical protein